MKKRVSSTQGIVERLIEEQISKWQINSKEKYKSQIRPVITISRLPGAGGKVLAKKLAEELKIDFFDHEIVEAIAKSAKVEESVIETLDEEDRSIIDDWISILDRKRHLWTDEYLTHLKKVVVTIGAHGYAVILGRGAGFILPRNVCLRVLIVAPLETRIQTIASSFAMNTEEARKSIVKTESDRVSFIRKYFKAEMKEPENYDLVINTDNINMDTAVKIITEVYQTRAWYNYYSAKDLSKL